MVSKKQIEKMMLNPLYMFSEEMKEKTIKKNSIQTISTIALALGQTKCRQQLVPFLGKLFLKETTQYRVVILKALPTILPFLGTPNYAYLVLQLLLDILCVYSQIEIRSQAYVSLLKTLSFIDIRKAAKTLIKTLEQLKDQNDQNIRELILKMIPCLYMGVDQEDEKALLQLLKSFKEKQSDLVLLSRQIKQLIKIMPPAPECQILSIIELLIKIPNSKIKINLIESIILLTKILGNDMTAKYLTQIMEDQSYQVICCLIKRIKDLNELFSRQNLKPIYQRVANFKNQHQQIKNAFLEVLEHINLTQQEKQQLYNPPTSLQLKNTLGQTLCRLQNLHHLKNLIDNSDTDFKIKIFPKLPQVCEMHLQVFESIFAGKNWRVKSNILQNLERRLENKENVEIFLPKLSQYLGDKIAVIRIGVQTLIVKIILSRNIRFQQYEKIISTLIINPNWFLRQTVYIMVKDLLFSTPNPFNKEDYQKILSFAEKGISQKVINIRQIAIQIMQFLKEKGCE